MMEAMECRRSLETLLGEEFDCVGEVLKALKDEREALHSRNPDALNAASAAKRDSLVTLEGLERDRESLLQAQDLPATGEGMEHLLAWCDVGGTLNARWVRLLGMIEDCKFLNEANGRIVLAQKRQIEEALKILRGQLDTPSAYGPGGEMLAGSGRPPLATA